ncbi:hypothetical protein D9757_011609 [Collybiopsis confluens]|uniref:Uncharacterized protein n=1 Tax=Collybiopsis confluens TaxID=2823264 RepID=A0A8H5LWC0_9AGAR|nr:hypothetical protein D9757_011609 [Collybiopsis confluens]
MASNKRVLSTSASDSTSSLEPLTQRVRVSEHEGPVVPAIPEYLPPYRSWEKLQDLKTGAFSSFANPRNHENAWHAPYSDLFHELTRPYRSLATHIQYRLWRLSSERSRTTFHRRFPPLAPPLLPGLEVVDAPSEPDTEAGEDAFFGDENNDDAVFEDEGNDNAVFGDERDDEGDRGKDYHYTAAVRLREGVEALLEEDESTHASVASTDYFYQEAADLRVSDLHQDNGPDDTSSQVNAREGLFLSTSTVTDRDNRDQIPDIVILHQETETLPEVDQQLEPLVRIAQEIYREHRCGRRTVHQCAGLIGELKRNIPRQNEMKIWGGHKLTEKEKRSKIEGQIELRLKEAKIDLAHYCHVYFKNFPLIKEVIAFATAGPYWQYAVVERGDVESYRPDEKRWQTGKQAQVIYLGKFCPWKEIGTGESDEALTEMRDLHLHPLAHDHCF